MKLSLNWLREFVDVELPVPELARLLVVLAHGCALGAGRCEQRQASSHGKPGWNGMRRAWVARRLPRGAQFQLHPLAPLHPRRHETTHARRYFHAHSARRLHAHPIMRNRRPDLLRLRQQGQGQSHGHGRSNKSGFHKAPVFVKCADYAPACPRCARSRADEPKAVVISGKPRLAGCEQSFMGDGPLYLQLISPESSLYLTLIKLPVYTQHNISLPFC